MSESPAADCEPPPPGSGYVHSLETGGTVDGPGIRYVIFLSGCPLRCTYCHNPDTREKTRGKMMRAADLIAEAVSYKDFMQRTGGGVTLTGGEPLYQPDFTREILQGCKRAGLHTALDTSGFVGRRVDPALLDAVDLVLLDIKSFDPQTYKKVTSHKLEPTLEFARLLAERKQPVWIRCVVVPNVTDDVDTYARLADFLVELGNVEKVELLPFHKMGEGKWQALGLDYQHSATPVPTPEDMQAAREVFLRRGLKVS